MRKKDFSCLLIGPRFKLIKRLDNTQLTMLENATSSLKRYKNRSAFLEAVRRLGL